MQIVACLVNLFGNSLQVPSGFLGRMTGITNFIKEADLQLVLVDQIRKSVASDNNCFLMHLKTSFSSQKSHSGPRKICQNVPNETNMYYSDRSWSDFYKKECQVERWSLNVVETYIMTHISAHIQCFIYIRLILINESWVSLTCLRTQYTFSAINANRGIQKAAIKATSSEVIYISPPISVTSDHSNTIYEATKISPFWKSDSILYTYLVAFRSL